jgi:hypothetical protein
MPLPPPVIFCSYFASNWKMLAPDVNFDELTQRLLTIGRELDHLTQK